MQNSLALVSLSLLAAASLGDAAAVDRGLLRRQSPLQQFTQFQSELQTFAKSVSTMESGLSSSAKCAASSGIINSDCSCQDWLIQARTRHLPVTSQPILLSTIELHFRSQLRIVLLGCSRSLLPRDRAVRFGNDSTRVGGRLCRFQPASLSNCCMLHLSW